MDGSYKRRRNELRHFTITKQGLVSELNWTEPPRAHDPLPEAVPRAFLLKTLTGSGYLNPELGLCWEGEDGRLFHPLAAGAHKIISRWEKRRRVIRTRASHSDSCSRSDRRGITAPTRATVVETADKLRWCVIGQQNNAHHNTVQLPRSAAPIPFGEAGSL